MTVMTLMTVMTVMTVMALMTVMTVMAVMAVMTVMAYESQLPWVPLAEKKQFLHGSFPISKKKLSNLGLSLWMRIF